MKTCQLFNRTLITLVVAVTLGCGKKDEPAATPATQVAAKVNSDEITVHQVNFILSRNPSLAPDAAGDAKREILNRLIEQQLAKQEALAANLDRSPNVVQAIEAARTEILARAHFEKITSALPRPSEEEIKKYYQEHPELFARRRVFSIEEIQIAPQEGLASALRAQIEKARSMQDVANWLKSRNAKFGANRGVRVSEQIPLEMLPKLHEMKDGAIQMFETANGRLQVIRIVASKSEPIDEAAATPRIHQFLVNRRSNEALAAELKRLKDRAQISYHGEFASDAAAADAKVRAETEAREKALAAAREKEKAETQARAEELARSRREAEARARTEAADKAEESARARRDADAKSMEERSKPVQLPQENIEKGMRGLR